MAEKKAPSRRAGAPQKTEEKKQTAEKKRKAPEVRPPSRRTDVIRCENCGEDYSVTYKRCPFCDERPGRGVSGRRVALDGESYSSRVNPIQVIGLVVSLAVIIAALFIVFRKVGPLIFRDNSGGASSVSTSQSGGTSAGQSSGGSQSQASGSQSSSQSGGSTGQGDALQEVTPEPTVTVTSIKLSRDPADVTLRANEKFQLKATVVPAEAASAVVWSVDDSSAATVDQFGNVTNVNSGTSQRIAIVTATCGDKSASCTVRCNPGSTGSSGTGTDAQAPASGTTPETTPGTTTTAPSTTPSGTTTPSTTPSTGGTAVNRSGTIVNADSGLNIRSGPGTSYDVVASGSNGATVRILEDAGNGWYKIDYGGGTGYVSSSFVSLG